MSGGKKKGGRTELGGASSSYNPRKLSGEMSITPPRNAPETIGSGIIFRPYKGGEGKTDYCNYEKNPRGSEDTTTTEKKKKIVAEASKKGEVEAYTVLICHRG